MKFIEVDRNPVDLSSRHRGFEPVDESAYYKLPTRSDIWSAGYDFYSTETVVIEPNDAYAFKTNIKAYMQPNEYLSLYVRSSIGIKRSLMLKNTTGIIDRSYYNNPDNMGNIIICLFNYGNTPQPINKGERIAQGIFTTYLTADVDIWLDDVRVGGIGSSGL